MSTRFYRAPGLSVERMARDLQGVFQAQGYQVQQLGNAGQVVVQFRKGSDFEAILGMQAALTVTLQSTPQGVIATAGEQQWIDKAAAGALGFLFLWPLILTAGAGMVRQASLESQLFNALDGVALHQRGDVHIGDVPPYLDPQQGNPPPFQGPFAGHQPPPFQGNPPPFQRDQQPPRQGPPQGYAYPQPSTPPPGGEKICPKCHAANDNDDSFCSICGTDLRALQQTCAQCGAKLKPQAVFCSKCGTPVKKEESASKQNEEVGSQESKQEE